MQYIKHRIIPKAVVYKVYFQKYRSKSRSSKHTISAEKAFFRVGFDVLLLSTEFQTESLGTEFYSILY